MKSKETELEVFVGKLRDIRVRYTRQFQVDAVDAALVLDDVIAASHGDWRPLEERLGVL